MRAFGSSPSPMHSTQSALKDVTEAAALLQESSILPGLKVSNTYFLYRDCKGHHMQYGHLIWDLFLTHFYADFTILILCLECIFLSFLL